MFERARWCVRNPGACAQVAREGASERIHEVREDVGERVQEVRERYVPRRYRERPAMVGYSTEGESEPIDRRQRREYRDKYGYSDVKTDDSGNVKYDKQGNPKTVHRAGRLGRFVRKFRIIPGPEETRSETYHDRSQATQEDYDILGVKPDASQSDVRSAYARESKKWHPDQNKDPGAAARFRQIDEAYKRMDPKGHTREYTVHPNDTVKQELEYKKGARDIRAESDRRSRARRDFVEEFCAEHPEECGNKRRAMATNGFCAAFPERCVKGDPLYNAIEFKEGKYQGGGLRRKNDFLNEETKEKQKAAELRRSERNANIEEFKQSRPGRFVMAVGGAWPEMRDTSRAATKKVGKFLDVQPARKYTPRVKKAPKVKRKTPRRYRMRATNAMNDVDREMDNAMGWYG